MKKLNLEYKLFLLRKANKRVKGYRKEARIAYRKRTESIKRLLANRQRTSIKISAPKIFYLGYTTDDSKSRYPATRLRLLSFIEKIKHNLSINLRVHISFKNTKQLTPSGTLIFVAELGEILDRYPGKVTIDYPDDDVVEQLFQHIGLLKRLGMTSRKVITAENVRHWDYVYGKSADASDFKRLFSNYKTTISEEARSGLFDSMSEAITNSIQHAYPCRHVKECECKKGWWMFAKQADNKLTVVIYDMGIGIPASLQRKPELMELFFKAPYRRLLRVTDTSLIDIAVESKRTSTRMPNRGKGLPDMLEFVKSGDVGKFSIYSRAGSFFYNAKDGMEAGSDYDVPITGTFFEWEIPLIV